MNSKNQWDGDKYITPRTLSCIRPTYVYPTVNAPLSQTFVMRDNLSGIMSPVDDSFEKIERRKCQGR